MHILRSELPTVDVTVSSDYSPDLAEDSNEVAWIWHSFVPIRIRSHLPSRGPGTTRRLNAQRPSPDDI